MVRHLLLCAALLAAPVMAPAQSEPDLPAQPPSATRPQAGPMTPGRLSDILRDIDPEAQVGPGLVVFTLDDVPVTVIYDPIADRMRAMVPVASAEGMTEGQMLRLMQANFDSALDARYAIAQGRVWSVFIHPLSPLDRRQLVSGVAQVVTLAQSYGTTFSSTDTMFLRGDSGERLRGLMEPDTDL